MNRHYQLDRYLEIVEYMKNKKSGIFILNKKEINSIDLQVIEYKANIIIDASINNLETYLNELKSKDINKKQEEKKVEQVEEPKAIEEQNMAYVMLRTKCPREVVLEIMTVMDLVYMFCVCEGVTL